MKGYDMKKSKKFWCIYRLIDGTEIAWKFTTKNRQSARLKVLAKGLFRRNIVLGGHIIPKKVSLLFPSKKVCGIERLKSRNILERDSVKNAAEEENPTLFNGLDPWDKFENNKICPFCGSSNVIGF